VPGVGRYVLEHLQKVDNVLRMWTVLEPRFPERDLTSGEKP
jgi:hypothetical protein